MIKDPEVEKERLIEDSERYKENFESEFSELTGRIERGLLTGLVVGGLAYLTYKVIRGMNKPDADEQELVNEKVKKKSSTDNSLGKVGQHIAQVIALVLINLAKEKLTEFLNERKQQDDLSKDSQE